MYFRSLRSLSGYRLKGLSRFVEDGDQALWIIGNSFRSCRVPRDGQWPVLAKHTHSRFNMKVVVTGASGLLGRAVKSEFTKTGHQGNSIPQSIRCHGYIANWRVWLVIGTALSRAGKDGLVKVQETHFNRSHFWIISSNAANLLQIARFDRFWCHATVYATRKTRCCSSLRSWATTWRCREKP